MYIGFKQRIERSDKALLQLPNLRTIEHGDQNPLHSITMESRLASTSASVSRNFASDVWMDSERDPRNIQ